MNACPTRLELQGWLRGELESERGKAIAEHREGCEVCRVALEEERRDEDLFAELARTVRAGGAPPAGTVAVTGPPSIPGYVVGEELYRGGQGIVYRATHEATGTQHALKILLRGREASTRERLRFEREVELAARLDHPGIVRLHASGIAQGRPYYLMELVAGVTLDRHLLEEQPGRDVRLTLFLRIADAIAAAHRRGVTHRDLKPANILVDSAGEPHVLDFGVAKDTGNSLAAHLRLTATGEFMGTLAYASPEQVGGKPDAVDTRTDVYTLGLVLYEMLTGSLPYDVDGGVSEVVRNILEAEPRDPVRLAPEWRHRGSELHAILRRALAKDPGERYASVEALRDDVLRLQGGHPVHARGPSAWYVTRKFVGRHRVGLAAATLLLFGIVASGVAVLRSQLEARQESRNAEVVREVFRDLLAAAAPTRMGAGVTLLEVYEEAADRIESELAGAPDAQAAFHLTIGDTYRELHMLPEAEHHLELALERTRRAGTDLEVSRCLDLLGRVQSDRNPPAALATQEEALRLRSRHLPPDSAEVAESELGLAIALLAQIRQGGAGRADRARDLTASAEAKLRALHGPRDPRVAEALYWRGRCALRRGEHPEGVRWIERSLELYEEGGSDDPGMALPLQTLARLAGEAGRFEEATRYLERVVRLTADVFGEERNVEILRNYASLHHERGDPATAETLLREALMEELARWARKRPGDRARVEALEDRLRGSMPPEREPPYAEAFAYLRACRGDGAFELASWSNAVARAMRDQGRTEATLPLLHEALEIHCRAYGADCPVRADSLEDLGDALVDLGRWRDAIEPLEELIALSERVGRSESSSTERARERLSECRANLR